MLERVSELLEREKKGRMLERVSELLEREKKGRLVWMITAGK
jgi:hypothetical protein